MKNQKIEITNDINHYKLNTLLIKNNYELLDKSDRITAINAYSIFNTTRIYGMLISGTTLLLISRITPKTSTLLRHILKFSIISTIAITTANMHQNYIFKATNQNLYNLFQKYNILIKNSQINTATNTTDVYNNEFVDKFLAYINRYSLTSFYFVYLLITNTLI